MWQGQTQVQAAQVQLPAAGRQPAQARSAGGGIEVTGCANDKVAATIRGSFALFGENHARPTFRRGSQDIFLYFWDERDGDAFCGWWFGPQVGGDQVWAYHPERAMAPPASGWHVPFGGAVDPTLVLRPRQTVAQTAAQPQQQQQLQQQRLQQQRSQQQQQQQLQQQRPQQQQQAAQQQQLRPQQQAQQAQQAQQTQQQSQQLRLQQEAERQLKAQKQAEAQQQVRMEQEQARKKREEMLRQNREAMMAKKKAEDEKMKQLAALGTTRQAIQKVRLATPETFEALKKEVDDLLTVELAKLGPDAANALFEEAEKHMDFARKRVEGMKEQQAQIAARKQEMDRRRKAAAEDAADPTAPPKIEVPAGAAGVVIGKGGATLKRIVSETGCQIDVQQRSWSSNGMVAISLNGVAKQRRLAAEAIHLAIDGATIDEISARTKGAIVVPHGLKHPGREEWLVWRMKVVEHRYGLKAVLTKTSVRFDLKAGPLADDLSDERAAFKDAVELAVAEAQGLAEETIEAKAAHDPTDARLLAALGPFALQYGVMAKVLKQDEEDEGSNVVPILVLGPPAAARDAAAMLWMRFVQGRPTAAVLQPPGRVQRMSELMSKDFDNDVRALEEECEVEVTQSEISLWLAGRTDEIVSQGRWTVYEMLQFYVAEDFLLLEGLKKEGLEKLLQDAELRSLALKPDCAIALHCEEGAAWLCGPPAHRGPLEQRVRKLAGDGNAAAAAAKGAGQEADAAKKSEPKAAPASA